MKEPLSQRLIDAAATLPPLRPATVLPVLIMLTLWIAISRHDAAQDRAFVILLVFAQVYAVWRKLPRAALALRHQGRDRTDLLFWPVCATVALSALQLGVAEPVFSQRLVSGACLFVLVVMVLGLRREPELLARLGEGEAGERVSLLRINALMAALSLIANEMLIATGDLTLWVVGMAAYALSAHAVYWFMVLLVVPPVDSHA